MIYVAIGVAGIVGVAVGVILLLLERPVGGSIVGATGVVLTAVGLVGFGIDKHRQKRSPARRLADEKAKEELAQREADEQRRRDEEQERRRVEDLRLARLRDLDRTRRAILAELGKLEPGVSLCFRWGRTEDTLEWREYSVWPNRAEFYVLMMHRGRHAQYYWPPGGISSPIGADGRPEWDANNPEDVERAYLLLQPERYLVLKNLPDDPLELADPGYFRHGVPDDT